MTAADSLRVFVVDDNLDTTDCLRLLLKHWGHDVHVANDGAFAIEQAPFVRPDLMLVDLAMPAMDGLTVARRLRQMPELVDTSLVALTGYADAPHRDAALAAGFDECLTKPLPAEGLQQLLGRVRSRVAATRQRVELSREMVARSKILTTPTPAATASDSPTPAPTSRVVVRVQKSGISEILSLSDHSSAAQLRQWLREQGCRVGPLFEPADGQIAFFSYSRRQVRTLLAASQTFWIEA